MSQECDDILRCLFEIVFGAHFWNLYVVREEEALSEGLARTTTCVPGGARGYLLKLYVSNK